MLSFPSGLASRGAIAGMPTHSVISVQQGGDIVGWAVLTDVPGEKSLASHLFRTEAEANAERDRLIAFEAQEVKSP
jgi:hypothetical protein